MFDLPDVAIGAVVASVIAGVVSLLGLIISKEQKTSEFRQAWINDLRKEVSILVSHTITIQGYLATSPKNDGDLWQKTREDMLWLNRANSMIRLLLNKREEPSEAILCTITDLENHFSSESKYDQDELHRVQDMLVEQVCVVLKEEWNRVRKGELTYRIAKFLTICFVATMLVWLMLIYIEYRRIGGMYYAQG